MSVYNDNILKLISMGYMGHPITPPDVTYVAAKSPVCFNPAENRYFNLAQWPTRTEAIADPQPNAGIGVVCGNGLVAFDCDTDESSLRFQEVFEETTVAKEGRKGGTYFYYADFPVPSENFYDANGNKVIEILSNGRQTVIPPSIHPDTKQPYRWVNGHSLYDTPAANLTPLPRDYRERIMGLGYRPEQVKPERPSRLDSPHTQADEGGNDWHELNQEAIKRLADWVPDLGLHGLKRNPGRGASYRAVPSWRPSPEGKPLEQRSRNLNIHPSGIRDEGVGKGYTAIDLVMAARNTNAAESRCWLEEKLFGPKKELDIDLDACADAPKMDDEPIYEDGNDNPDDAWVGKEWEDGDPIPAPLPMLIPYFVPLEPYLGYLWGQSQTYKTFLLNTMAVAVASGGRFAGQEVTERGLVYQVELEGSRSQLRIQAAKQFAGIEARLPIVHVTKTPPSLIGGGKRVSSDWKKWAGAIVRKAKAAAERWGVPLKLITIDPQNHFAGFTDEQSSAEGNVVCNALIAMAKDAGCPVLVADHLGKDPAAGGRGTSVKHQSPWFILDAGESAEELGEDRVLIIRKMKDGEDGLGISFHMEKFPTEINQQVRTGDGSVSVETATHDTLVVVFEGEVRPVNTIKAGASNPLTDKEMIVLNNIISMTNSEGRELPPEYGAPKGLKGIPIERLQVRVTRNTTFAGKGRGAALFQRTLDSLMAKKKIDSLDSMVWVPIAD